MIIIIMQVEAEVMVLLDLSLCRVCICVVSYIHLVAKCKVQSTYRHSQRHMAVDSLNYPLITDYDVVGNLTTLSLI